MIVHKLLLADDSVTIQRVIELTFSGEDIEVVAVNDGEQAIARIPTERPDIVLADIGMPRRSGYDVAAFVKADPTLKHIPVLLMAGAFEPVDDALAAECGCDGVLVKPFEPQHVIARVKELLEGGKGSPTRTSAAVPRPVERLALRPDDRLTLHTLEEVVPPDPEIVRGHVQSGANDSLDEYFDRLDAAFSTLTNASAPPAEPPGDRNAFDDPLEVPTLDALLGADFGTLTPFAPKPPVAPPRVEPPDADATRTPRHAEIRAVPDPPPPPPVHSVLSDAFSALLAVEQGDPGAEPVRFTTRSAEPEITEAFIDEVVRRVLDRISSGAAREVVAGIVSEVTERLVREEIDRRKK